MIGHDDGKENNISFSSFFNNSNPFYDNDGTGLFDVYYCYQSQVFKCNFVLNVGENHALFRFTNGFTGNFDVESCYFSKNRVNGLFLAYGSMNVYVYNSYCEPEQLSYTVARGNVLITASGIIRIKIFSSSQTACDNVTP